MRDKRRISRILNLLRKVWNRNPDLRLLQLIINITDREYVLYHLEDDQLEIALREWLKKHKSCQKKI